MRGTRNKPLELCSHRQQNQLWLLLEFFKGDETQIYPQNCVKLTGIQERIRMEIKIRKFYALFQRKDFKNM